MILFPTILYHVFTLFHCFSTISTIFYSISTQFPLNFHSISTQFPLNYHSVSTLHYSPKQFTPQLSVSLTPPRENRRGQIPRSALRFASTRPQMHSQLLLRLRHAQRRTLAIHPNGRRDHASRRHHHHGTPFPRFAEAYREQGSW